jgi:hypothetical protein
MFDANGCRAALAAAPAVMRAGKEAVMGYLAFAETAAGSAVAPVSFAPAAEPARFSPLEWSVIALAKRDRIASLREPGRISTAMGLVFGERPNPRLADPRLEALRRLAVLSWHYGYTVPGDAVRGFLSAGFTARQYELMVDSIAADREKSSAARARRAA